MTPTATDHAHARLSSAVRATSVVTLLSRFAGLVREVLLVWVFGPTSLGSAFAAAFAIPNTFRRLFGEGALSSAFVPEYTEAERESPAEAGRFARRTIAILGLTTALITILAELGLLLALLLAPHSADRALMLRLVMLMFPFMPAICIAAILAGMLQVHGRFAAAASGPIVLNTFIIVVGLYHILANRTGTPAVAYALGAATVLSGFTQCLWFTRLLRRDVAWDRERGGSSRRIARMTRRFVPVAVGLGTLQINSLIDTLIATWPIWAGPVMLGRPCPLDGSSNIILSAVQRLYQFPLGVFGIAVASAAFPLLARHNNDDSLFASMLRRGIRLSVFIGVPASFGLYLVRSDIVAAFYSFPGRQTSFTEAHVARGAAVLAGYAVAVWAYSVNHVLARAFYARGDTRTPLAVSMFMVAVNLALNFVLVWPLREAGLAWATSISAVLQTVVLAALAHRRLRCRIFELESTVAVGRILAISLLMALLTWSVQGLIPAADWYGRIARLGAAASAGAASFAGLSLLFRLPEFRWLIARSAPTA